MTDATRTAETTGALAASERPPGRIYEGRVFHTRSRPVRNVFSYRIWFVMADVERLDEIAETVRGFGRGRGSAHPGGIAQIRDRDHGPRDGSPLRPWIDSVLERAGIRLGDGGRVELLTFGSGVGGSFFPVALWYCYAGDGTIRAYYAEVNNTFGEHHGYLLHKGGESMDPHVRPQAVKAFRVSPFIEMEARYTFTFSEPGDRLKVSILDTVAGEPLLVAAIDLEARPLDAATLRHCVMRYGPMPLRAGTLIGYQALKLLARGLPWLDLPKAPEEEISL